MARNVAEGWILVIDNGPAMAGVRKYRPLPGRVLNG